MKARHTAMSPLLWLAFALPFILALLLALIFLAPEAHAPNRPQAAGHRLLSALETGTLSCDEASSGDFSDIGRYVMARMVVSPREQALLNGAVATMAGPGGEGGAYALIGRRFAGCGGRQPAGMRRMTATMAAAQTTRGRAARDGTSPLGRSGGKVIEFWSGGPANESGESFPYAVVILALGSVTLLLVFALRGSRDPGKPPRIHKPRHP